EGEAVDMERRQRQIGLQAGEAKAAEALDWRRQVPRQAVEAENLLELRQSERRAAEAAADRRGGRTGTETDIEVERAALTFDGGPQPEARHQAPVVEAAGEPHLLQRQREGARTGHREAGTVASLWIDEAVRQGQNRAALVADHAVGIELVQPTERFQQ